ncbi:MAG TPA: hypothetical protein EYP04_05265 [Anaerolineae bacterium]|nr:hypothetical protein [Anaerolineae bacterium]HIQ04282.1 hypothetical protein [Anaerolineae bacterium]
MKESPSTSNGGQQAGKLDPELRASLQQSPDATFALIVRVRGPADERRTAVERAGMHVRRVFRLVPGLAVQGTGKAVLALAEEPWVIRIEPDREVHTMEETTA